MKIPGLFATAMALSLASVAARADGLFLTVPIIPGPSGRNAARQPPARPLAPQVEESVGDRLAERERAARERAAIGHGEPDETGRIGPTVPLERGPDGKLLPSHRPR